MMPIQMQKIREAKRHADNVQRIVGWVEEEASNSPASEAVVRDLARAALQKSRELMEKLRELA